jgi:hypothetical protein
MEKDGPLDGRKTFKNNKDCQMGQVTSKICFVGTAFILKIWPIRVTQHPILGEIIQQV